MTAGINDFRPDDWEPDDMLDDEEPEHVCSCNAMHDDLEHAENLCSACGLMLVTVDRYCELTGRSEYAVRYYINKGVWTDGSLAED